MDEEQPSALDVFILIFGIILIVSQFLVPLFQI